MCPSGMCAYVQVLHAHHGLSKGLLDQVDTALVHRLTIGQETALQRRGYRGQTLRRAGRERIQSAGLSIQWYPHRAQTDSLSTECFAPAGRARQGLTSNKGKRSLSSSFNWFHFWIKGGINIWMYS